MFASSAPWRRISCSLLLALVLLAALLGSLPARAASTGTLQPAANPCTNAPANAECRPANCSPADANDCGKPVGYNNGNIQHDPIVYLIFWGPKWTNTSDPNYLTYQAVINAMFDLFKGLAGTAYNNILTQYYDSTGYVHNDVRYGGTWNDQTAVPSGVTLPDLENQVSAALAANQTWSPTQDSQFMVFPQAGSILPYPDTVCGAHDFLYNSSATAWSWVRYSDGSDPYCSGGASEMPITASHEYAETATDPTVQNYLTWGWTTGGNNIEIGDECEGNSGKIPYSENAGFPQESVQWLWDQSLSACVLMRGQDYASPDYYSPFHGVHTVQGPILTEYMNLGATTGQGAVTGSLGQPLTEQVPLAGGQVSYFASNVCNGGYILTGNTGYGGSALTSGSAIYYSSSTGAHEVQGCIYYKYTHDLGGPGGALGFPTGDECGVGDRRSSFQHGTITWIQATGQLMVQYSSNPPTGCGGSSPGMVALTSGNTFVAIGNTLYKYDLGTTGTSMLSTNTNGTSGPHFIGYQTYSYSITALAANEQYLFVALSNHRVIKTNLCDGGANMCALSDGIGSGSLPNWHDWIGYQDFSVSVTGLAATPTTLYTNLAGGGVMRTLKTTLCDGGANMCALSDGIGSNTENSTWHDWIGYQDWAWAPTALAANDTLVLTTIGTRVCKTTPGSNGSNVFALNNGTASTCVGTESSNYNFWIGYQDWAVPVTSLAIDNTHIWWSLGSIGRLVQTTWCDTGANICALTSDGIGTNTENSTWHDWIGRQDWCAGYTQLGVASNNTYIDALFTTGSVTRVVKATQDSGVNMFATSDCTGTGSLATYHDWIGSQDFTVS